MPHNLKICYISYVRRRLTRKSAATGLLPETVDFPIDADSFDSEFCRKTLTEMQGEILTPGYSLGIST